MMDMGQQLYNDAGAAGALPPSSLNSNSLPFSPPSALTSNESLFLLDPDFSPFSADPSTEPFGIPLFSAPTGSDFASVLMDQYSANAPTNSSFMEGLHQASPGSFPSGNGGFYAPADEGSGTSTNSMQEGGQAGNLSNITSANSQVHASLTNPSFIAGNNQSMALDERNPSLQSHYDSGALSGEDGFGFYESSIDRAFDQAGADQAMSQEGSSFMASQGVNPSQGGPPVLSCQGVNASQGGPSCQRVNAAEVASLPRVNSSQGGRSLTASRGGNQSQGAYLQRVNPSQGRSPRLLRQAGCSRGRNHKAQNQDLLQQRNVDFSPVFVNQQQQFDSEQATISNVVNNNKASSALHESGVPSHAPEAARVSTLGFEPQTHNQPDPILGNSRAAMMQSMLQGCQQGPSAMKRSVAPYQGGEGDASILASCQDANSLFQPGMSESCAGKLSGHNPFGQLKNGQHQQNDVHQRARNSSFQFQGRVLPSQSPAQLESIFYGKGQNHSRVQGQNQYQCQGQVQSQDQGQEQVQSVLPQIASTNQQPTCYPSWQLSGGVLGTNQKASFHSIQPLGHPNPNSNLQLNGVQQPMITQTPRLLNPMPQALNIGPPQRSAGGFSSDVDGNARTQMPPPIAARCIQIIMQYIQEQQKKPSDNDISFWRNLFKEFFVPDATKRWCLSSYNSSPMGRHAQSLFPMDYWFCNICGVCPGRGFESSTDVLPRLFKIKYASGLLNELLFLDMPEERYMLPNGRLVLEFPRVVHESVFTELRVVRYGRLRVTLSSSFKIYSWEFCAKIHEEVVPRKSLFQQAQQLARFVLDHNQEGFDKSIGNLKAHCQDAIVTVKQLESKLEAPTVNDLGFSKRYVRCLQIAEVVNSMKDLISFERKTGLGPLASLSNFPTMRKLSDELLVRSIVNQPMSQLTPSLSTQLQGPLNEAHQRQYQHQHQHQHQNLSTVTTTNAILPGFGQQIQSFGHQMQPSQTLGQPVNFSHIARQMYESVAENRQILLHPTRSYQTGPQSLPGTPQSEMSDIRTNA